jgi:lipoyl(octanoyl) transferase
MMPLLRIIIDPSRSAGFNMAADIWSLQNIPAGQVWLRLYSWEAPTITLGFMQKPEAVLDLNACRQHTVCWIRRITGGRAVLHDHDITYSCVFPKSLITMGKNIAESYEIISRCLMHGLALVNISAKSHGTGSRATPPDPDMAKRETLLKLPCFISPNCKEIIVNNKKLIGSAQKRTDRAILQHGSVPLTDTYQTVPDYLQLRGSERARQKHLLQQRSVCVWELDPSLTEGALVEALARGFKTELDFSMIEKPWTAREIKEITSLSTSDAFINQWMKTN